jgi:hypothetical protein
MKKIIFAFREQQLEYNSEEPDNDPAGLKHAVSVLTKRLNMDFYYTLILTVIITKLQLTTYSHCMCTLKQYLCDCFVSFSLISKI